MDSAKVLQVLHFSQNIAFETLLSFDFVCDFLLEPLQYLNNLVLEILHFFFFGCIDDLGAASLHDIINLVLEIL